MIKKFELTDEFIEVSGKKLFRIRALISFGIVSKGEKGGFVEKEGNLTNSGNAWVSGDAQVYGNARVSGICNNVIGKWNITITDEHLQIGCELHTIEEWFSFTDSQISKMHASALEWWNRNKTWLKGICETRGQ